jgi:hypothetical protein
MDAMLMGAEIRVFILERGGSIISFDFAKSTTRMLYISFAPPPYNCQAIQVM